MERVNKGEKYWFIDPNLRVRYTIDTNLFVDDDFFTIGNYFHTEEEAEAMAHKLRAVLKGADVIEMPSERDIKAVAIRHCGPLAQWSGSTVDAFIDCAEWLKSKIVK